jgi:hypothetical protein
MKTTGETRTPPTQPGRWRLLRHYLEMVAWMRHRRHRWTPTLEPAGAMVAPAAALVQLWWLACSPATPCSWSSTWRCWR